MLLRRHCMPSSSLDTSPETQPPCSVVDSVNKSKASDMIVRSSSISDAGPTTTESEFVPIVSLRTMEGDILDEGFWVASLIDRGQELVGLTQEENNRFPPRRSHPFFAPAPDSSFLGVSSGNVGYDQANSKDASGAKAVGVLDPREVKNYLRKVGFTDLWIDIERVTSGDDLFEQLARGMMTSNVFIAFVSDEYAASKNCIRELNFAVNVLKIPFVTVVIGEGDGWRKTRVGLLTGDQVYIVAQDPSEIEQKLETLVSSLVKIGSTLLIQDIGDDDDNRSVGVTDDISGDSNARITPSVTEDLSEVGTLTEDQQPTGNNNDDSRQRNEDATIRMLRGKQLDIKIGDKVECIRWRRAKRTTYVMGGLHWEPVQVLDIAEVVVPIGTWERSDQGAPENGDAGGAGEAVNSRPTKVIKRYKVRLNDRVMFNARSKREDREATTEWVEEYLLRSQSKMTLSCPPLIAGDACEFRQYVVSNKTKSDTTASDTQSEFDDELIDDTYDFWPGIIEENLGNGFFSVRQGYGWGISAESGDYVGTLKTVHHRMLRIGEHYKMLKVKFALDRGHLVVTDSGAIIRRSDYKAKKAANKNETSQSGAGTQNENGADVSTDVLEDGDLERLERSTDNDDDGLLASNDRKDIFSDDDGTVGEDREGTQDTGDSLPATSPVSKSRRGQVRHGRQGRHQSTNPVKIWKEATNVFIACLSPEYLASDIHMQELKYARDVLKMEIIFVQVTPLNGSAATTQLTPLAGDPFGRNDNPSSPSLSTILETIGCQVIDLTVPELCSSRCTTLAIMASDRARDYGGKCRAEEDLDRANPPWQRTSLCPPNKDNRLEGLCAIARRFKLVDGGLVVSPTANNDDNIIASGVGVETALESQTQDSSSNDEIELASLVWMAHQLRLYSKSPDISGGNMVTDLINNVLWLSTVSWTTSLSGLAVDAFVGRSPTRPAISVRLPASPSSKRTIRQQFKIGCPVEVRLHIRDKDMGNRYFWWPGKIQNIVEPKSSFLFDIELQNANTDVPNDCPTVLKGVHILQLKYIEDLRTTKWWPTEQYYLPSREEIPEVGFKRAKDVQDAMIQQQLYWRVPKFRTAQNVMERHGLESCNLEARRRMTYRGGLHNEWLKVKVGECQSKVSNAVRMVARMEGDPDPTLWGLNEGEKIEISEDGLTIQFDIGTIRNVLSAIPCFIKGLKSTDDGYWKPYIEVEVVDLGCNEDSGFTCVSIGTVPTFHAPFSVVGWNRSSVGIHSLNGRLLKVQPKFRYNSRPYGIGDRIGVGMDCTGTIFFTMNGSFLYTAGVSVEKHTHLGISADGPALLRIHTGERVVGSNVDSAAKAVKKEGESDEGEGEGDGEGKDVSESKGDGGGAIDKFMIDDELLNRLLTRAKDVEEEILRTPWRDVF
ncbi:hypothetical protein HDU76_002929 [Blyttiomyces sp. JEL0837]|nr:hypothetical protein HDU76_002929 [Blyttiomyces sp. JEL0837]